MDFNTSSSETVEKLTTVVTIGWEHDVVTTDDGEEIVFKLDDNGERIPRSYVVPLKLTASEMFERAAKIDRETALALSTGDLSSIIEIVGVFVGDEIVESVGTDRSVSTADFLAFLDWCVDNLRFTDLFGAPGN